MRFLVFGAGAIGTYIGGSLALAGNEVVFLERPESAANLQRQGLVLEINGKRKSLANPTILSSAQAAFKEMHYEAAILAVKAYDTKSLLDTLMPFGADIPPVLCLQNGVENEDWIADRLGSDRVISGTVTSAIGRLGPGAIRLERLRGVGIAASQPLCQQLANEFSTAGLNARLYPHAQAMKWSKMLTNLLANASSAILGMTPAEVYANPHLYHIEIEQLREALRVMRALSFRVTNLPGTPVRLLAWAVQYLPEWASRVILKRAVGSGRGGKMPSFYLDLKAGSRQSEVEYLNGAVVRYGKRTNIPTPVNQILNKTLMDMAQGRLRPDEFDHRPDKLLALFERPL